MIKTETYRYSPVEKKKISVRCRLGFHSVFHEETHRTTSHTATRHQVCLCGKRRRIYCEWKIEFYWDCKTSWT